MPRYGNRWLWSQIELQRAVLYLRARHGNGRIHMADISRAALAVCGRSNAARVLRDRLVLAACLIIATARGRAAAYVLTPDAEECIAIAEAGAEAGAEAAEDDDDQSRPASDAST
jgi:hypothetical protein